MQKSQMKILWILIAVVIAAIIGLMIWYYLRRNSDKKKMIDKIVSANVPRAAAECLVNGLIKLVGLDAAKRMILNEDISEISVEQAAKIQQIFSTCGISPSQRPAALSRL